MPLGVAAPAAVVVVVVVVLVDFSFLFFGFLVLKIYRYQAAKAASFFWTPDAHADSHVVHKYVLKSTYKFELSFSRVYVHNKTKVYVFSLAYLSLLNGYFEIT